MIFYVLFGKMVSMQKINVAANVKWKNNIEGS